MRSGAGVRRPMKSTRPRRKTPVVFKKVSPDETAEEIADALCDALLPIINEERRKEGLGPLPD
jgi:hypothetical protein